MGAVKNTAKALRQVKKITQGHWVGDGFPVTTMFSYAQDGVENVSPFLMLDYAGPVEFEPADKPRGVEVHPHRGFETVTIVYSGELEHKDSAGNAGKIKTGDVQWMTAGAGILHEEMHSAEFTAKGGVFEVVQLWVNLPAAHKMTPPKYQEITNSDIPVKLLDGDNGFVRVIAGDFNGAKGAASTFTPVDVWDMRLRGGGEAKLSFEAGRNTMILVLRGRVDIGGDALEARDFAMYGQDGEQLEVKAQEDAVLLILSGEPIDEPIVGRGPFVMNTHEEIQQAFADYRAGKF